MEKESIKIEGLLDGSFAENQTLSNFVLLLIWCSNEHLNVDRGSVSASTSRI